jgi:hypothetical protein
MIVAVVFPCCDNKAATELLLLLAGLDALLFTLELARLEAIELLERLLDTNEDATLDSVDETEDATTELGAAEEELGLDDSEEIAIRLDTAELELVFEDEIELAIELATEEGRLKLLTDEINEDLAELAGELDVATLLLEVIARLDAPALDDGALDAMLDATALETDELANETTELD